MQFVLGSAMGREAPGDEMSSFYDLMVRECPQMLRGLVWCRVCGRCIRVNPAECLRRGWPECCGETMTLDAPSDWKGTVEIAVRRPVERVGVRVKISEFGGSDEANRS